jgi:parafibromin
MADVSVTTLQQWATEKKLEEAKLSEDGATLSLNDVSLPAADKVTVTYSDKSCEYSLASIFLQILDPGQGLLKYRGACKKYNVQDPVKASDKPSVVAFFIGEEEATTTVAPVVPPPVDAPVPAPVPVPAEKPVEPAVAAPEPQVAEAAATDTATATATEDVTPDQKKHREKKHRDRHDKHHKPSSSSRDRHDKHARSSTGADREKKKQRKTIDNEKLFSNLNVVVDKRSQTLQQNELQKALSPEGFDVTPEILQSYKESTQTILSWEIPVGNSASILQAAAGKDLSRILKLYMDTVAPSKSSKQASAASQPHQKNFRQYLIGKKPVIIVPKGMQSPITLINAHEFFGNGKYIPREVMMKKQGGSAKTTPPTTFSRRIAQRLGGVLVEYEIMDNPKTKLHTAKDWERVVAVVALGASWQFKDWPDVYKDPVHLFGKTLGVYIGMEGAKVPAELQGWSVLRQTLNRDKRGLDSVTYASFWNGLDEFMTINKPELLPQQET